MKCNASPVAKKCYADAQAKYGNAVYFLGIIGDQAHQSRSSGHNCGAGRELSCTHPSYAHAVDIGLGSNSKIAFEIINELKKDSRVHYMIYRAIGYRPNHRGGGTFSSSGHETHVHVSFGCGSTFDVRPFFKVKKVMTKRKFNQIIKLAEKKAKKEKNRHLRLKSPRMKGNDVRLVQKAFNGPKTGRYGVGTYRAVKKAQKQWGLPVTGKMNQKTWTLVWFYHLKTYLGY